MLRGLVCACYEMVVRYRAVHQKRLHIMDVMKWHFESRGVIDTTRAVEAVWEDICG